MIGYLNGTIKIKESNSLILDVNNVGYQITVPLFLLENSKVNDKKEFFIYTHVREDALSLYGFDKLEDKNIFLQLISVSGVGPKTALRIISIALGAENIIQAIQNADVDFFMSIKGIGKKSSQRIIVDLKSKIGGLKDLEFDMDKDADLYNALKNLGFSHNEIKTAVKGIDTNIRLEEKIKKALIKHGKS